MKPATRVGVLLPAVFILASGCATKGWVRETLDRKEAVIGQRVDQQLDQRDAKITERIGGVEGRVTGEAQRVDGMGQRLGTVEGSLGEVSATAAAGRDAGTSALAKADGVDRRLSRLWSNRYSPKVVETVDVFFGFDRWDLDDGAQTALLALIRELQANPSLTVELMGYTDSKGARDYNYQLSQRRVDAVRRFLVDKGVGLSRIQAVGLGPLTAAQTPQAQKRRVSAKLMLDQD
ncbi:MAG TPA: OmpA family protein [Methylomirabilota bacterium]|jgi:outer membrane protein OmpA-like peptidoglycan-associated protein|nr:OmpA family protein [Methylomirabilota bacterium]